MSYRERKSLFCEGELDTALRAQIASVRDRVDGIPRDQFLATSEDTVVEHIHSSMEIEPIQLHEDSIVMDQQETKIDVSRWPDRNLFREPGPIFVAGIQITVTIPFSGDPQLWKLRPNPCQMSFPHGAVHAPGTNGLSHLDIVLSQPSDQPPDALKQELDRSLRDIRSHLEHQRRQIEQHNASLPNVIRQVVQARRVRLQTHDGIVQALNIPLKRRDGVPEIRPIAVRRKLVRPLPVFLFNLYAKGKPVRPAVEAVGQGG